jgi:hypothetical protein
VLREEGTLLLYAPIAPGRDAVPGALAGMLVFRQNGEVSDGDGVLNWLPPWNPGRADRVEQIARRQPAFLSRYTTPAPGALPLAVAAESDNASFLFSTPVRRPIFGPRLPAAIIHMATVTLTPTGFAAGRDQEGFGIRATVRPRNGLFSGSLIDPDGQGRRLFTGVLFQKTQTGHGTITGSGRPGAVLLSMPAR